jgi:hypothetical protein
MSEYKPKLSLIKLVAGSVSLALLVGGTLTAGTFYVQEGEAHQAAAAADESSFYEALTAFRADEAQAVAAIESADRDIASAEEALSQSDGKVLDEAARDALATKLTTTKSDRDAAQERLASWRAVRLNLFQYDDLDFSTAAVILTARAPIALIINLESDIAAVSGAVELWEEEQARIAEQGRLEAERVSVAAENARTATGKPAPTTSTTPRDSVYSKNVWTSGWQAEIDACKGAVDITSKYDLAVIAEHTNCGGGSFPSASGTIVKLTGVRAGTYRILGVVATLPSTSGSSQIPRGYDLLFQVCGSGKTINFIGLEKIG